MIDGQISIFDIAPDADWQEAMIREAFRRGSGYTGSRVRIWAMLESNLFPQYRDAWMKAEFGIGGRSLSDGWFMDYNSGGVRISYLRGGKAEIRLTWKQVVQVFQRLIASGDFFDREDERQVEAMAQAYPCLPYPRARMKYPECAWGVDDTPIWRDEKEDDE